MAGNADFINILRDIRGSAAPGQPATDGIWYELTIADKNGNPGIYGDILAKYGVVTESAGTFDQAVAILENLNVEVTTLPAGSQATSALVNGVWQIGIPRGTAGINGTDGFTPVVGLNYSLGNLNYTVTVDGVQITNAALVNLDGLVDTRVNANVDVQTTLAAKQDVLNAVATAQAIADGLNVNVANKIVQLDAHTTIKVGELNVASAAEQLELAATADAKKLEYDQNAVVKTAQYDANHTTKLNEYNANDALKIEQYNANHLERLENLDTQYADRIVDMLNTNKILGMVDKFAAKTPTEYATFIDTTNGNYLYYLNGVLLTEFVGYAVTNNTTIHLTNPIAYGDVVTQVDSKYIGDYLTFEGVILEERIGQPNGVAGLDSNGLVPSTQLPSYVDDVIEVPTQAALPAVGELGKIYVVVADETSGGDTSSYRWAGSAYAMISNSLTAADIKALYESNADTNAFTDADKQEVNTIQSRLDALNEDLLETIEEHTDRVDNPHEVTKAQVGLGNADNTADMDKVVASAGRLTEGKKINNVEFDNTQDIVITANTPNSYAISFDSGTNEGTDVYTFDGSEPKSVDIVAGTNVELVKEAGKITINVDDTSTNWDELQNVPSPTITLSGDVSGSAVMTELGSTTLEVIIQPNSVELGVDTTGDYVGDVTGGEGITVTGVKGENWIPEISITPVGIEGTYTKVTTNDKGQVVSGTTLSAEDIPDLDASKITTGIISADRLPSYVDDVLEFPSLEDFPAEGESGKIYVALDTNKTYRWGGTSYVYITSGAVDSVAGKTGVVTLNKNDVGLDQVDNTSDSNKPVSTATANALALKSNIESPEFTGIPKAPTAAVGTSTTQLATTAFVNAEIANDTYSKTQLNAGQLDNRYYTEAEINALLDAQNDASEIKYSNTVSGLVATTVQAALDEVEGRVDTVVHKTGDEAVAGVKTFTDGLKLQGQNVSPFSGFKNHTINGNFSVWQRGTSFSATGYCADRWLLVIGGSANAMIHNVEANTILLATVAASSFANLYQAIETATVIGLRGKTLTLSLKLQVGGTHTGGFALSARYSNSTDILNSQTTSIKAIGIFASSTNTRYSLTFTVPVDAVGLRIDIENLSVQSAGALYQVQEVQLEEGSVATPFENRPYVLELSLCQRYYEVGGDSWGGGSSQWTGYAISGVGYAATTKYKVRKRISPTIVLSNIYASGFSSTVGGAFGGVDGFAEERVANATSNSATFVSSFTASAEL